MAGILSARGCGDLTPPGGRGNRQEIPSAARGHRDDPVAGFLSPTLSARAFAQMCYRKIMNKPLLALAVLLGIAFVGLAAFYWLTPAGSLPTYIPGFEAGSPHIHFKHGLAALILGLGLFVFAWFKGAPKKG